MYAVVVDRNQQVKVQEGESLLLDYNAAWDAGTEVVLDKVCLLGGDTPQVGTPFVDGAKVVLEVIGNEKGEKIVIGKFKRRKTYRRKAGFRAQHTRVKVKSIQG